MAPFGFNGWVYIAVQGNLYIRMPQYLAQALHICPVINAIRGKGMAKDMEIFFVYINQKKMSY